MVGSEYRFIGNGIYSIPEAARLIKTAPKQLYRWVRGHNYTYQGVSKHAPPIIEPDYQPIENSFSVSFADLMELRFIKRFRECGISLQTIRIASQKAQELLERSHPFSSHRFRTDGRTILAEIQDDVKDIRLFDLLTDQFKFREILARYLYDEIEFSDQDIALRWFPGGFRKRIVIDPNRCFGKPIVHKEGVPTEAIRRMFFAEETVDRVVTIFEVSRQSVISAIEYEQQLTT